eukprot:scaffold1736_cov127-Cylindrotheca_fusiformis.AAC.16
MAPISIFILLFCYTSSFTVNAATSNEEQSCPNGVDNENSTCKYPADETTQCGVWLGHSTLPGTGIGMFAGKDFRKGDPLLSVGDHIIPIVDLGLNHAEEPPFLLWNEYTWNSDYFGMTRLGIEEVDVASPGFGAAANSFMDFVNVQEEETAKYSTPDNVHRSKDPEAGAFTYYHSRNSFADRHIKAGEELFVSYGDKWYAELAKKFLLLFLYYYLLAPYNSVKVPRPDGENWTCTCNKRSRQSRESVHSLSAQDAVKVSRQALRPARSMGYICS